MPYRALLPALALALAAMSCSTDKAESSPSNLVPAASCASDQLVAGACAGVPSSDVCDGDVCTPGVSCDRVAVVATSSELAGAAAGAGPGTCLALAAGDYDAVALPAGVRLLGKGAAAVRVAKVAIAAGAGAVVRGLTVGAGGLAIDAGATDVRLESVAIVGSTTSGLSIGSGSSVTLATSEIRGAASYGIVATDAARVRIESSRIEGSKGPGVWSECAAGCACANHDVALTLSSVVLRDNRVVGLSLIGVKAELDGVDIMANAVAEDFTGSGGVSASQCSELSATRVRVLDNSAYGMLIDGSSATLGNDDPTHGVEVSRNTLGVWIQNVPAGAKAPVVVRNAKLMDNAGVGIGLMGGKGSVDIRASDVGGTSSKVLPSIQDGVPRSRQVGHGVAWMGGAHAQIDGLRLHGNKLASLLVDGEAGEGSIVRGLIFSDGDDTLGVIQQNLPSARPPLDSLPGPQRSANQLLPIPTAPALPGPQRAK